MFAEVYYFVEFKSWGVTLYDEDESRARDEDGHEIEAEWFYLKPEAVRRALGMLTAGEVSRVDVFTRTGKMRRFENV